MDSIAERRADDLYRKNMTADVTNRELEAAYLEAEEIARRAYQDVVDRFHPQPEFCGRCGKWLSTDRYLTAHLAHDTKLDTMK